LIQKTSVNRIDTVILMAKLTDRNDNTFLKIKREINQAESPMIQMDFNEPLSATQIAIVTATNLIDKISITYLSEGKDKWKNLTILNQGFENKNNLFTVNAKNIQAIRITFTELTNKNFVDIFEIKMNVREAETASEYVHVQTGEMKLNTDHEKFIFDNAPASEFAIFYKVAATSQALNKLKYNADSATLNSFPQLSGKGNVATFLMVIKRSSALNAIQNPRLQTLSQ
ncbi:MAG: hypothetical protein LH629_08865, partial [Ignavibacteria bacterium]|nr:hypothetical protein [Ignavibacteria bacterium]